jgi:hypothetical protein
VVAPVENRGRTDDEEPDDKPTSAVKAVDGGPVNLLESLASEPIGKDRKIKNKRQVPTLEFVYIFLQRDKQVPNLL